FLRAESENVAQDEHFALAQRQFSDGRVQRCVDLGRLELLCRIGPTRRRRRPPPRPLTVAVLKAVGIDRGLAAALGKALTERGEREDAMLALAASARDVEQDREHPAPQRRSALEPRQSAQDAEHAAARASPRSEPRDRRGGG